MFCATNSVQAEGTTAITTTLPNGTEQTIELKTAYGEGNTSVTQNFTVLGQEIPYTYKFDNLYGDTESGNTSVDTEVTVLGQPVTFTYKIPNDYTTEERVTDLSTANVDNVLFQGLTTTSYGGAIYNENDNSFVSIIGDFIGNYAQSSYYAQGGAICNYGTIGNVTGDFIGNYADGSREALGGAIFNFAGSNPLAQIGDITGDFIGNYAEGGSAWGAKGAAIYNYANTSSSTAQIGAITGDFIGNYVQSSNTLLGGVIHNYASSSSSTAKIGDITGNFIGNYAYSSKSEIYGGVICNEASTSSTTAQIDDITGDFIGNYASSSSSTYGGVIYNKASQMSSKAIVGTIKGDFIGNYVESSSKYAYGGVICNDVSYSGKIEIGDIIGDFIGNYAYGSSSAKGGVIYNYAYAPYSDYYAKTQIGVITADFIGNYAYGGSGPAYGGAIYNYAEHPSLTAQITAITGDFIGNYAYGSGETYGGAIYNTSKIANGIINSSFLNNYAKSTSSSAQGGAIWTDSDLNIIAKDGYTSTISGNYVEDKDGKRSEAIRVASQTSSYRYGSKPINGTATTAVLYKTKLPTATTLELVTQTTGKIIVDDQIVGKSAEYINGLYYTSSGKNQYVELNDDGTYHDIETPEVSAVVNSKLNITGDGTGLVQLNNDVINVDVTLDNSTLHLGQRDNVLDGNNLLVNSGTLSTENNKIGTLALNSLVSNEVAKYALDIDLANKTADKFSTTSSSSGTVTIDKLNFLDGSWDNLLENESTKIQILNTQSSSLRLALSNNVRVSNESILKTIQEVVSDDMVADVNWQDVFETTTTTKDIYGTIGLGTTKTTNDSIAVNVTNIDTKIETTPNGDTLQLWNQFDTTEEKNFNFDLADNVYTATANLGATNGSTLNINGVLADDGTRSTINFAGFSGFEITDAIDLNIKNVNLENSSALITNNNADSTINLTNVNIRNNTSAITTNGDINITADGTNVELSGYGGNVIYLDNLDKTLTLNLKNGGSITQVGNIDGQLTYKANIVGDDINTSVYNLYGQINNADLRLGNFMLNTIDGVASTYSPYSLTINQDTNMTLDVDLANKAMDRFDATTYGQHSGNLIVNGMNLVSDANQDVTSILFAEYGLKDYVKTTINEVGNGVEHKYQTTAYSPIYKYTVSYDNKEDAGYFVFTRPSSGGAGGSTVAPSNPSANFNPAVLGSSTSATVGATATMNTAFNYSFQHSADFMNIPYLERISYRDRNKYALSVTGDATDMGRFSPLYQPSDEEASVWVKPYATFETVGLKNGPKVHNNTYGTLIGFDTEMQSIKNGWDRVFTGYIGYNGASQRYAGIDSTQNGGLIGGTMTLYKGNFFNATTVSVGASVANNQTMYGSEDFAMLLSGIGNKTGYNFEFKEGRLILQPSMLMSYTFVNTFDYTNAAGVRIDNKPLHALQLAPGVKVIGNLKDGWQPYASVQMVWNLMGESDATANGVKLPEMSIKPYVQYGVGLQKRIKDHFTAYGQAMIQNGGRNGVSLTAGFRWALGHDKCKYDDQKVDKSGKLDKCDKSVKSINGHPEVKTEGAQTSNEILRSAQNDSGKSIRHLEQSERSLTNLAKDSSRVTHVQNDGGRKILKQIARKQ